MWGDFITQMLYLVVSSDCLLKFRSCLTNIAESYIRKPEFDRAPRGRRRNEGGPSKGIDTVYSSCKSYV